MRGRLHYYLIVWQSHEHAFCSVRWLQNQTESSYGAHSFLIFVFNRQRYAPCP